MATPTQAIQLSGPQKAAVLLVAIGEEASAEVMRRLSEDEVKILSRAIARLNTVPAEQVLAVMEEFDHARTALIGAARAALNLPPKS